mmetsp:Transcript_11121/g.27821  ORF Transcript_11121/g.27821 Transcript_11121/m.27821 type:complete len:248 (-) Transcript_11121:41-784(-)
MASELGNDKRRHPSPCFLAFMELLKLLDWFTELLKVVCNQPAAGDYFGLACATLAVATVCLLQKQFDQAYVMLKAADLPGNTLCLLGCVFLPVTVAFLPWTLVSFKFYRMKAKHYHEDLQRAADTTVFSKRPLSTVLLGLPVASVYSLLIADARLVYHPVQVHLRATQTLVQTLLEDVFSLVVDFLVILHAPEGEDISFYWLSFCYSIFCLLVVAYVTLRDIKDLDRQRRADSGGAAAAESGQGRSV